MATDHAQKLKKTGLTSRNWTDSSNFLDERQIKECGGGEQSLFPRPDLSRKIERDSARMVRPKIYSNESSLLIAPAGFWPRRPKPEEAH